MIAKARNLVPLLAIAVSFCVAHAQNLSLTRVSRTATTAMMMGPMETMGAATTAKAAEAAAKPMQSYPVAIAVAPTTNTAATVAPYAIDPNYSAYAADCASNAILVFNPATQNASASGSKKSADAPETLNVTQFGTPGSGPGQFRDPRGVAVDLDGNVYVADSGNNRIQKLSRTGDMLLEVGHEGTGDGELNSPIGVAVNSDGDIFVADSGNHRIQRFSADGTFLNGWGSRGSGDGQFFYPQALAADGHGNVFVADFANHRIQKFTKEGAFLTSWGQYGNKPGQFNYPSSISVDAQDRVWVSDLLNHRLQVFSINGQFQSTVGSFSPDALSANSFNYPRGVAVSPAGDIWVAHPGIHAVDHYRVETEAVAGNRGIR